MDTLDSTQLDNLRALGEDILAEIVQVFLHSAPNQLAGIDEGLDKGDLGSVRYHAHSLKGASANVGAVALQRAAKALEYAARDEDEDRSAACRVELFARYDEAVVELQALV